MIVNIEKPLNSCLLPSLLPVSLAAPAGKYRSKEPAKSQAEARLESSWLLRTDVTKLPAQEEITGLPAFAVVEVCELYIQLPDSFTATIKGYSCAQLTSGRRKAHLNFIS